jgi:hypothetical protein
LIIRKTWAGIKQTKRAAACGTFFYKKGASTLVDAKFPVLS